MEGGILWILSSKSSFGPQKLYIIYIKYVYIDMLYNFSYLKNFILNVKLCFYFNLVLKEIDKLLH